MHLDIWAQWEVNNSEAKLVFDLFFFFFSIMLASSHRPENGRQGGRKDLGKA